MSVKTKSELLEENIRIKKSYEDLERRIATLSKWIFLNFDPVPAEIKIVLQYKDYDLLHSRIKDYKRYEQHKDISEEPMISSTRRFSSRRKKNVSYINEANEDDGEEDQDFDAAQDDFFPESDSDCETNKKECEDVKPNVAEDKQETKTERKKRKKYKRRKKTEDGPKKDTTRVCHICSKVLATNKSLKHHLKTHSSDKPFLCNECGQSFIAQYYLTCHLRQHIPIEERKKYECDVCGSVQTNKAGFNRHKRRHAGLEQHQCPTCGVMFTGRSALRRHIVGVHEKRRPHGCSQCDKQFKTRTHLKTHMKVHEGDKMHRSRCLNRESDIYIPRRRGPEIRQPKAKEVSQPEVNYTFHPVLESIPSQSKEQEPFNGFT